MQIHATDCITFLACEREWHYKCVDRIFARAKGPRYFAFGNTCHEALATWYARKAATPVEAFLTLPNIQKDLDPAAHALGLDILTRYYRKYRGERKRMKVLAIETPIVVPIPGTDVELTFTLDLRYRHRPGKGPRGDFGMDHKFLRSPTGKKVLELEFQMTCYLWGCREAGIPLEAMVYNCCLKKSPHCPRILKNGKASVSRRMILTDKDYIEFLVGHGFDPDERRYSRFIAELRQREDPFFIRREVRRTNAQLDDFGRELTEIARRMSDPTVHRTRARRADVCSKCSFYEICLGTSKGTPASYYIGVKPSYPYGKKPAGMR